MTDIFTLQVEGDADRHNVASVRAILEALCRKHGLRLRSVRGEVIPGRPAAAKDDPPNGQAVELRAP
jgi:hypothetical protein